MNGVRGETCLEIDGKAHRLCLTLGALAEIETAFGCQTLGELQVRLRTLSATELMTVIAALLRGGGEVETAETVRQRTISPGAAARAVAEAFHAAVG
ncbi:gene transfer agent family protein [Henriciella aquimarina]|uniref:gene transfer agent family protein n=1 Tax=Henriciella aquimarina TaxID=545261 RepID=UPI000A004E21|nr:gene transfer agent family protein [Henriciella aquimarina]